ncbi:hypothetical protein B0H11DRAFT_2041677 [Mycena galericulata]|nr:hypothetical protein B0H11DRAFT_2041677 [Mycena galericulata]
MSGGRGCFNCGGCALSSSSLLHFLPPFSLISPSFAALPDSLRHTHLLPYIPGTLLTMIVFFFLHISFTKPRGMSWSMRGRIYCFSHQKLVHLHNSTMNIRGRWR